MKLQDRFNEILEEDESICDLLEVIEIKTVDGKIAYFETEKNTINEISLKVMVNGEEMVSMLCMNQSHEELAVGFLYDEGIINTMEDILSIDYYERMQAVMVQLREGIFIDRNESLRSITSGCGRCYTYINPLKVSKYQTIEETQFFTIENIMKNMAGFLKSDNLHQRIGGVHSLMLTIDDESWMFEDIGRHNCFDKMAGMLIMNSKISKTDRSIAYVSGRLSSEIITKAVRMQVPIIVTRSTPTAAAVALAKEFNITLLGYVNGLRGYIFSCPERIILPE